MAIFRQPSAEGDRAATEYFKRASSENLTAAFSPIVDRSMQRVGVVQQYNRALASESGGSALAGQFDLKKYVVAKTLDGLFLMLGDEEKKIRTLARQQKQSVVVDRGPFDPGYQPYLITSVIFPAHPDRSRISVTDSKK